jgi:phosphopantetheinyl transferase (holo-ACP synthase)
MTDCVAVNAAASMPIEAVAMQRRRLLDTAFCHEEQDHFGELPTQSVAAALCLKYALLRLARTVSKRARLAERDIELYHTAAGALAVRTISGRSRIAAACRAGELHVSVSHTRTTAYALATMQPRGET